MDETRADDRLHSSGHTRTQNEETMKAFEISEMGRPGVIRIEESSDIVQGANCSANLIWPTGNHELPSMHAPLTKGNEAYPWNYQWYIQQMAHNKGEMLYSTKRGIRERKKKANEFGGAPLGNDILHPSCVDDLPNQRREGVFDPIREAAIAQGILRNANRWREKLKVPHRQRMVAQQSRADLMCLQRWRTQGKDEPEMLAINPNIAPLTATGAESPSGLQAYRQTGARHNFGPYC